MSISVETSLGSWLKGRRRELGITQEELADRISCSLITLQKIEAGERRPSRQVALLLAERFGIPLDERDDFVAFARTGQSLDSSSPLTGPGSVEVASRTPWRMARFAKTNLPSVLTPLIGR